VSAEPRVVVDFPFGESPCPSSEGGSQPEDATLAITKLHKAFRAWHHKPDVEIIDVSAATYLSVHENDRPLGVMIVAPPSFAKTETVIGFRGQSNVHLLSKVTPQTFTSGLKNMGDKVSLLKRLPNPCMLLFKDFTTILNLPSRARNEILSQLREVMDGSFDAGYGTGLDVSTSNSIGVLACCTQVIDNYSPFMQTLGERFLYVRPSAPDGGMDKYREKVAEAALDNGGKESAKKDSIRQAMTDYLAVVRQQGRTAAQIKIPDEAKARIVALADFISLARTSPIRHWRTREIEGLSDPEGTPRLASQFGLLARCLALARQRPLVNDRDMATVIRVGFDTLTILKRRLYEALTDDWQTTAAISTKLRMAPSATTRHLEDAFSVRGGLVEHRDNGDGEKGWRLSDKAVGLAAAIGGSGL